ncbi:SWIM-type domain-containing protein [Caerostris extrusa]|uniref:SWIM-type domain-containing protein n=1 Tax=Caerostris extrusa TaxID=172846 RepID=A0AAV4Q236_CAEEX|nr:SWIM-type domain-containing protein [Caerostris extrusa]
MIVAIRRHIKYSRSKMRDPVDPVHPCEIQIRFIHNHPTNCADSLRFRPVSKEVEEKINKFLSNRGEAEPYAFMIEDSESLQTALRNVWPDSDIFEFFGVLLAPSLINKGRKRSIASAIGTDVIVPKVHGRQMITYGKKRPVIDNPDETLVLKTSENNS